MKMDNVMKQNCFPETAFSGQPLKEDEIERIVKLTQVKMSSGKRVRRIRIKKGLLAAAVAAGMLTTAMAVGGGAWPV